MQTLFNFSTDPYDLERFADVRDFRGYLNSFTAIEGIELLSLGTTPTSGHANQAERTSNWSIPSDLVKGVHARSIPYWLDFWQGNEAALRKIFPDQKLQDIYYGSNDANILVKMLEEDVALAHAHQASYLVWHVSDSAPYESLTRDYAHSDAEVIDASLEIINEVDFTGLTLLLENLWYPGLRLTTPENTERLLQGIKHPDTGIMFDTGHLAHTNTALRSQEEAVAYIHQILDRDSSLASKVRGIHLNMSLTGEYVEAVRADPPPPAEDYDAIMNQLFSYVFQVDLHQPFIADGVRELVDRIDPDWLTLEFITFDRAMHEQCLRDQLAALKMS